MVSKIKHKYIFKTPLDHIQIDNISQQPTEEEVSPRLTNEFLTTEKYQTIEKSQTIEESHTINEYQTAEDYLTLTIKIYEFDELLKKKINNLSMDVDNLVLNFKNFSFYNNNIDYLDNIFTNLPVNLKTIKFMYPSDIEISNEYGFFNLLFNIKIPLNCNVFLTIDKTIYNISYTEPNTIILIPIQFSESVLFIPDEIILTYNLHKKIKYRGGGGGGLMHFTIFGASPPYLTGL